MQNLSIHFKVLRWIHRYIRQRTKRATYLKTFKVDQNIYYEWQGQDTSNKLYASPSPNPSRISFQSPCTPKKQQLLQLHNQKPIHQQSPELPAGRPPLFSSATNGCSLSTYNSQTSQESWGSTSGYQSNIYEEIPGNMVDKAQQTVRSSSKEESDIVRG